MSNTKSRLSLPSRAFAVALGLGLMIAGMIAYRALVRQGACLSKAFWEKCEADALKGLV